MTGAGTGSRRRRQRSFFRVLRISLTAGTKINVLTVVGGYRPHGLNGEGRELGWYFGDQGEHGSGRQEESSQVTDCGDL